MRHLYPLAFDVGSVHLFRVCAHSCSQHKNPFLAETSNAKDRTKHEENVEACRSMSCEQSVGCGYWSSALSLTVPFALSASPQPARDDETFLYQRQSNPGTTKTIEENREEARHLRIGTMTVGPPELGTCSLASWAAISILLTATSARRLRQAFQRAPWMSSTMDVGKRDGWTTKEVIDKVRGKEVLDKVRDEAVCSVHL